MTANERAEFAAGNGGPIALQRNGSPLLVIHDYAARYSPDPPDDLLCGVGLALLRA